MPTTDVTNGLIANITSTEQSTSNVPINRSTGNPTFLSNVAQFVTYLALGAGPNNIPLPFSPITQVYVKNIDSAKTVSVSWTPAGGSPETIPILNPGDQLIFWGNPAGGVSPGITALSMNPSAAGCLVEYFLGG